MEMPSDTHTHTHKGTCVCVGMWSDGWIGQGMREGYKRGVDGRLMKMKEQRNVYLRAKEAERRTASGR